MSTLKNAFSALLVVGMAAGILSQSAFANNGRFAENHPRRAEVMGRDHRLGNELREDKGHLGGNYNNLMAQDRRIHMQERRDARQNGGHITRQEQYHLNREENRLNHRIERSENKH